ncbi:response regulator [Leptolyngbya sp. AN02str]|uniref:response regulator n=1 Tax=Leptolyngbya sp. AN02str TaxID=3423363 RepID=UPI003D31E4F7
MESGIPELENISQQLMSLERPRKPKMLVVDDEPDNLDLLYRTFRRDFNVLRAESGVVALQMLAQEGEVAVIISDQRMPEMKGTEFLSKTVPQFPDTMRIILTGFTDVEDLVEAINSGQVYKYITKPWDPNELKAVVQRAAETYDLMKQRTEDLRRAHAQTQLLGTIVKITRKPTSMEAMLQDIAAAFSQTFDANVCLLHMVEAGALANTVGVFGAGEEMKPLLTHEAKAQDAIATQKPVLIAYNVSENGQTAPANPIDASIQANLLIPAIFQDAVLALISLQWKEPRALRDDELTLLGLSVQQVALALTCAHKMFVTA